ncbi:MAG: peptidoglycan-binding protein [Clostridia bacterium]|nr:peptidoglycan-binding protein [Clostridia bacterium]
MKRCQNLIIVALLFALCLPSSLAEIIVFDDSAFEFTLGHETPEPLPTPFVTLQRGAKGDAVKQVQTRLTELGYYSGKISGDFLDGTDAATRSFQRQNKLAVNGKITPTTWNAMMSLNAIGRDGRTHPPQGWNPTLQEEEIASPDPAATPVPASAFVYTRKLEYGNQGDDVRLLQQRLLDLGYFPASVRTSGNYYANTRDAVRAFQRNNGLKVDGVAGQETQRVLWDDSLVLSAMATPRPTPTPPPLPYKLMVDVTNQITSAYALDENGEYTVLARQMICSTGTKSNPTPLKTTESRGTRARWGYFPQWGTHAQYLVRIDSKNAFHSVIYSAPDPMRLVVSAYNALGSPASYGCVRLLVEDAKWIYDNCPSGTVITVFAGEPDPELTESLKPPPLDRRTMLPQAIPQPTPPPVWDPMAPPPPYRIMNKGTTGPDVWWLQTKLAILGYYKGTVTGGYFGGTIAAVKAFQADAGLKADGIAGPLTLAALYENPVQPQLNDQLIPIPTPVPLADDSVWLPPPPPPGSS